LLKDRLAGCLEVLGRSDLTAEDREKIRGHADNLAQELQCVESGCSVSADSGSLERSDESSDESVDMSDEQSTQAVDGYDADEEEFPMKYGEWADIQDALEADLYEPSPWRSLNKFYSATRTNKRLSKKRKEDGNRDRAVERQSQRCRKHAVTSDEAGLMEAVTWEMAHLGIK
jgi:hypothetical protein